MNKPFSEMTTNEKLFKQIHAIGIKLDYNFGEPIEVTSQFLYDCLKYISINISQQDEIYDGEEMNG